VPEIEKWQQQYQDRLLIILISRGSPEANCAGATRHRLALILLQRDREVADAYGVVGVPSAVLVNTDGRIGSPLAEGAPAVRQLVAGAAQARGSSPDNWN
jgi:hypothetical protein